MEAIFTPRQTAGTMRLAASFTPSVARKPVIWGTFGP